MITINSNGIRECLSRWPMTARSEVNYAINTGQLPNSPWLTFDYMNHVRYEMRRALLGIDGPNAWCGRNARLRRMIDHLHTLPGPRLP